MKPPGDIKPRFQWRHSEGVSMSEGITGLMVKNHWSLSEAVLNSDAHGHPCRVYWGSHGCARPAGHEGPHWCDCCDCEDHPDQDSGCVAGPPYYGQDTHFYGEDSPGFEYPEARIIVRDEPWEA